MKTRAVRVGQHMNMSAAQRRVLDMELGYDTGERYTLIAVSGYDILDDTFGTVFTILDEDTGDEVEVSPAVGARDVRSERVRMLARVMHLNGLEDEYAA